MATNSPKRLAWDSNVVIDSLEKEKSNRYQWVKPLIVDADDGKLVIIISSIAVAETCRIDGKDMRIENDIIRDFFDRTYVELYSADRAVAEIAREIRTQHNVDGADSLHIATAIRAGVGVMLTNDGDSTRQKNKKKNPTPLLPLDKKLISDGKPLRIMTPQQYQQILRDDSQPMFAKSPTGDKSGHG